MLFVLREHHVVRRAETVHQHDGRMWTGDESAASATPRIGCPGSRNSTALGRDRSQASAALKLLHRYVVRIATLLHVRCTCQARMNGGRMRARFTTDEIAAAALRIVDEAGLAR